MAVSDYDGEMMLEGRWRYDGAVPKTVAVVAFDCDYFRDRLPMDDGREEDVRFPLTAEGVLYYVAADGDVLPNLPFQTVEAARAWADAQPWGPITWAPAGA